MVYIPRLLKILQKYEEKFLSKIYSKREIEASKKFNSKIMQARFLAKRFAAKEAFIKALGNKFTKDNTSMKNIEIFNDIKGKPYLLIKKKGSIFRDYIIHLTLSDEVDYAAAFVVICV